MTQTDFIDGIIIFGSIAVTIWYGFNKFRSLQATGDFVAKTMVIFALELILIDCNIFEATVAARVGSAHGAPWSNRFAMHIAMGAMSGAAGLELLNQVLQFIKATVEIFIKANYKKIYNWLNFFKQGLDVFFIIVVTLFGPIFNWTSIAYSNGDITIHKEELMANVFSISGWFSGRVFDSFELTGQLHNTTYNSGGAVLLHILTILALTSFFLDLGQFRTPEFNAKDKKVHWNNVTDWIEKYFGIKPSEVEAKVNADTRTAFITKNNIVYYAKLCFDAKSILSSGDYGPEDDEYKRALTEFTKGVRQIEILLT